MAVYKCYFYLHDNELSFLAGWVKEALCHETEKGGNRAWRKQTRGMGSCCVEELGSGFGAPLTTQVGGGDSRELVITGNAFTGVSAPRAAAEVGFTEIQ